MPHSCFICKLDATDRSDDINADDAANSILCVCVCVCVCVRVCVLIFVKKFIREEWRRCS